MRASTARKTFSITCRKTATWSTGRTSIPSAPSPSRNVSAKLEADFYAGVSGVTGTALFRLRQAYVTLAKGGFSAKIGQTWHPMAADMPHVFSLNTGAPFGPFSRTPEVVLEGKLSDSVTLTGALLWQMQYTSAGPEGASVSFHDISKHIRIDAVAFERVACLVNGQALDFDFVQVGTANA